MRDKLKSLKPSKSPGPDGIHPRVLRELADVIADPLKQIFDKSLSEGKLPSEWKDAEVRPIFKKGDKTAPGNYRPVSLTSVVCKVFESFIRDALYNHLVNNKLLSTEQFGFCKGRSCLTQLLATIYDWFLNLDNNIPVDAVYLDLRKAFDTVPHQRLLNKLNAYGIQGLLHNWIEDFLYERSQYVSVSGSTSSKSPVSSGVPQGSVLGPVLFIYYINDMPDLVLSTIKLFADDNKTYNGIRKAKDQKKLQDSINQLTEWTLKWLLEFNILKCKVMHLGSNNPLYDYYIKHNGQLHKLEETTSEKDLGVFVDPLLSFESHITETVSKARKISGLIIRTMTYKSPDIMVPLFKSLIRPILEYANPVWNPYLQKFIDQLEKVQRNYTKAIVGMKDLDYEDRLKALKLPSLEFRRFRGDLIETFKICRGLYDTTTTKKLISLVPEDDPTCSNGFKLYKTRTNYKNFKCFFTNRIINPWNSLPAETVNAGSVNSFKNNVDKIFNAYQFSTHINHLYY